MTLRQFRDILLAADPGAKHYESSQQPNYTIWTEIGDSASYADDRRGDGDRAWKIHVDRFTKVEYDPVVDAIRAALVAADISFEYLVDYEPETKYIHHIFDCVVI